jgi:nucleoside-diphosphate-sugar epimerase
LIYRDDVVEFLLRVTEAAAVGGVYNLVDDQPSRKQEIANWLARRCGKEAPLFDVNLSGPRGERRKAGGKLPNRRISNRRIKERFGWQLPTPDYRAGYEKILRLAGW